MRIPAATLHPGCKVNLVLRVLGRRPDGYHDLDTLFWPLASPADTLAITPGDKGNGVRLASDDPALAGEDNLVAKACRAFSQAAGVDLDMEVRLTKRIPIGAGLGGGSSDGAAMLSFLNQHAGDKALARGELAEVARSLGADMPFFLLGRPAWAQGTGERLTPLSDAELGMARGLHLVLLCPPVHVSTAWAYRELDHAREAGQAAHPAGQALTAQNGGDIRFVSCRFLVLGNDFESVVFPAHQAIRELKEHLLRQGAGGALMSGSGASVFGLFRDAAAANRAAQGAAAVVRDTAAYVCAL